MEQVNEKNGNLGVGVRSSWPRLASVEHRFMSGLDNFNLFLFIILIILASMQVLFRYALVIPVPWTEELCRFLLVWLGFLGAASATRRKLHILVDYFVSKMPVRFNRLMGIGIYLLILSFLTSILWGSIKMVGDTQLVHFGTITWLSVSYLYLSAVIGGSIMWIYVSVFLGKEIHAAFLTVPGGPMKPSTQRGEVILTWIFLIALLTLIFLGMPIAFSMGVTTLIAVTINRGIGDIPHTMIAQRMVYGINSFPLLAIPFFLLVGRLMNTGGITDRIYNFCSSLIGHVRGGLAHVNIMGSMIFAGMTGSAVSDAIGLGQMEIKAMVDQGYDKKFSAATTAASATIGPIIPPSIPMVLYGVPGQCIRQRIVYRGDRTGYSDGCVHDVCGGDDSQAEGFPPQKAVQFGGYHSGYHSGLISVAGSRNPYRGHLVWDLYPHGGWSRCCPLLHPTRPSHIPGDEYRRTNQKPEGSP